MSRAITPSAMTRFWRITARLARLSPTAKGNLPRSSAINATSAVSSATAVPAPPMAIPKKGAFRPFAEDGGASGGGQHQHIGVEFAADQARDGMRGNIITTCEIGQHIKEPRGLRRHPQERFTHPTEQQKKASRGHQQEWPAFLHPVGQECRRVAVVMVRRFGVATTAGLG